MASVAEQIQRGEITKGNFEPATVQRPRRRNEEISPGSRATVKAVSAAAASAIGRRQTSIGSSGRLISARMAARSAQPSPRRAGAVKTGGEIEVE